MDWRKEFDNLAIAIKIKLIQISRTKSLKKMKKQLKNIKASVNRKLLNSLFPQKDTALNLPNLLIVGGQRCGTSSMHAWLQQHPEVLMSRPKETRFFISDVICNLDDSLPKVPEIKEYSCLSVLDYINAFKGGQHKKIRGEASPQYLLYYNEVIPRIKFLLGDVKIVLMLRSPVERAKSAYKLLLDRVNESRPLDYFFRNYEEFDGYLPAWQIYRFGLYSEALKAYLSSFSEVNVILFDDLESHPDKVFAHLSTWLGIDNSFVPDGIKKKHNTIEGQKVSDELDNFIGSYYKDDIQRTSDILNRDLSYWLP